MPPLKDALQIRMRNHNEKQYGLEQHRDPQQAAGYAHVGSEHRQCDESPGDREHVTDTEIQARTAHPVNEQHTRDREHRDDQRIDDHQRDTHEQDREDQEIVREIRYREKVREVSHGAQPEAFASLRRARREGGGGSGGVTDL